MRKYWYPLFILLVVIGLADSIYLSLTAYFNIAPVCGPLHGCETVAQSIYSRVWGIPLAYFGVFYYVYGALLSGFISSSRLALRLSGLYALVGSLASVLFIYIQVGLIGSVCVYCLISAATTFLLLAVVTLAWKNE
jgi:uncharacterized membrane protein